MSFPLLLCLRSSHSVEVRGVCFPCVMSFAVQQTVQLRWSAPFDAICACF
jgi:hypothetical protein